MSDFASISLKGFRAIKEAEIKLNGITVISGINGSGKSTISQLLYYVFKYSNDYKTLVLQKLNESLRPYYEVFNQIRFSVNSEKSRSNRNSRQVPIQIRPYRLTSLDDDSILKFQEYSGWMLDLLRARISEPDNSRFTVIIDSILPNRLNIPNVEKIDSLKENLSKLVEQAILDVETRPISYLKEALIYQFDELPNKFDVTETLDLLFSSQMKNIPIPHSIKNVIYINTPITLGLTPFISEDSAEEWVDLFYKLKKKPIRSYNRTIYKKIKEDIIRGEVYYDNKSYNDRFVYKTKSGKEIDFLQSATGIKSFAAIQMLLKNGALNRDTLLILDEPEAHLHPQWIVEYANILEYLHRKVGVKIFVTSHSTDMVSAIRNIAEKNRSLKDVSFYLAESEKSSFDNFRYVNLKQDIEPIFASFNKSYDVLDEYLSIGR